MTTPERSKSSKSPLLWTSLLVIIGVLLLLSNFLLLQGFNLLNLAPLLLVILGAGILLRGDILPSDDFRTFGITRGNIESASLEISAGDIDVTIEPIAEANSERLITGQYAQHSRPSLDVQDVHAALRMERSQTPWLSFADWDMALSRDLPWQIVATSAIGQMNLNLSKVIIQNALISTGLADIHLTCPAEAFEALYLRSNLGHITVHTPLHYNVRIAIEAGRFSKLHVDESRYELLENQLYLSKNADSDLPMVDIVISNSFGDIFLT